MRRRGKQYGVDKEDAKRHREQVEESQKERGAKGEGGRYEKQTDGTWKKK